jgi:hypothetical protein
MRSQMLKPRKRALVRAAAKAGGVTVAELLGPSRKATPSRARAAGMVAAYFMDYSYQEAAELFNRVEKNSAIWARKQVEKDAKMASVLDTLLVSLGWRTKA